MAQALTMSELPPGYRSNLARAIHADDPQALLRHLDACSPHKRSILLSVEGGKIACPVTGCPWDYDETRVSRLQLIDNELFGHLCDEDSGNATLHTLAFTVAAEYGCVRIVLKLLSNELVDPAFDDNRSIRMTCYEGHVEILKLLLNDSRVDPSIGRNIPIRWASGNGHVELVRLLLNDPRVDPSDNGNLTIRMASTGDHVEIVKLLLQDERVDPSAHKIVIETALEWGNIEVLQMLFADVRIIFTNELLSMVDDSISSVRVDALFAAGYPCIWPRVIGNEIECVPREMGHLRNKLDGLELKSSWMLLLCVKRFCTSQVAAKVGDVMRDVCSEWTCYRSREV